MKDTSKQTQAAPKIQIRITKDEFGTFFYQFEHNGQKHECFDFPSVEEALKGANWHIHCIVNKLPHEVCDGLGCIYRPELRK